MTYIPTLEQAHEIIARYSSSPSRLRHAEILSAVLGHFARKYDPILEDMWRVVGLLHDLDIEQYPDEHCLKLQDIMRELNLDPRIIRAAASHGFGNKVKDIKPEHIMEKVLYTANELCVLMDAAAQTTPGRTCAELSVKYVVQKYDDPNFLPTCPRRIIDNGLTMLGWKRERMIAETIEAMRAF